MALLNFDNLTPGEGGGESEAEIDREAARPENQVEAIIKLAVFEIERNLNGVQYKASEAIRHAEDHVDLIAKALVSGESSNFDKLRAACAAWVEASRIKPAPGIDNAELFMGEK